MEITIQPSPKPLCSLDQAIKCRNKIFFESTFTNNIFHRWKYNVGNKLFNFFFGLKKQAQVPNLKQSMDLLLYQEHYLLKNTQLWKCPGNV